MVEGAPLATAHLLAPYGSRISCIYSIVNLKNGKTYIGKTINIRKRLPDHTRHLKLGNHYNFLLQRAFNKYGINSFVVKVLEYCDVEDLYKRESFYIQNKNTSSPEFGYNVQKLDESGKQILTARQVLAVKNSRAKIKNSEKCKINQPTVDSIRKDYNSGDTISILAKKYNIKHSYIASIVFNLAWYDPSYVKRTKLPRGFLPKEIATKVIDLLKDGKSHYEISKILNLGRGKVYGFIKQNNLTTNKHHTLILDTGTGIYYNSVSEAAKAKDVPPHRLQSYLSGRKRNKTSLIKV